jgi:hypothetical protein
MNTNTSFNDYLTDYSSDYYEDDVQNNINEKEEIRFINVTEQIVKQSNKANAKLDKQWLLNKVKKANRYGN